MRLSLYSAVTDTHLVDVARYNGVSVAVGLRGMDSAQFTMPYAYAAQLGDSDYWQPGGVGPLVQIDASDVAPWLVYTGQCGVPNQDAKETTLGMGVLGPQSWLEMSAVRHRAPAMGSMGVAVRQLLASPGGRLRLREGHITEGPAAALALTAQSAWAYLTDVAAATGMEFRIHGAPGETTSVIDVCDPAEARDLTSSVKLVQRVNAAIAPTMNLTYATDEFTGIAASYDNAAEVVKSAKFRAPAGIVIGRDPALKAIIDSGSVIGGSESGGDTSTRLDLIGHDGLRQASIAELRSRLTAPIGATVTLRDTSMITALMPGDLVSVEWPTCFFRPFRECVARVETMAIQLDPAQSRPKSVQLGVVLWKSEAWA